MIADRRGISLGKAAIARATRIGDGTITTVDVRVSPVVQVLGITFDANHNITNSTVTDAVAANTTDSHTHSNSAVLDAITASFTTAINTHINDLETRLAALELALAGYASHTHDYSDGTVADTDIGGSAQVDATRTTAGVN